MEESRSAFKILTSKPTGNRDFYEGLGVDGRAINLVDSAQDRDYWRALGNAPLNLQVP